jgi:hypothetical protein
MTDETPSKPNIRQRIWSRIVEMCFSPECLYIIVIVTSLIFWWITSLSPSVTEDEDVFYLPVLMLHNFGVAYFLFYIFGCLVATYWYAMKRTTILSGVIMFIIGIVWLIVVLALAGPYIGNAPHHVRSYRQDGQIYHEAEQLYVCAGGYSIEILYECDDKWGWSCHVIDRGWCF